MVGVEVVRALDTHLGVGAVAGFLRGGGACLGVVQHQRQVLAAKDVEHGYPEFFKHQHRLHIVVARRFGGEPDGDDATERRLRAFGGVGHGRHGARAVANEYDALHATLLQVADAGIDALERLGESFAVLGELDIDIENG